MNTGFAFYPLLITILVFSTSCSKQNDIKPKDGEVKTYYENKEIKSIENYKSGILQGESSYFREDGSERKTVNYSNGNLDGIQWIENPRKQELSGYPITDISLSATDFTDSGKVTHILRNYKDGELIWEKAFLEGGAIKECLYKNRPSIECWFFNNDGNLRSNYSIQPSSKQFTDGKFVKGKKYNPEGYLVRECFSGSGNINCKSYFSNGMIRSEETYDGDCIPFGKEIDRLDRIIYRKVYDSEGRLIYESSEKSKSGVSCSRSSAAADIISKLNEKRKIRHGR